MLVYYFVPFIVSNCYLLFWVSNGHNSVTVQNRTYVYMNFSDHKDLGNHLLQLCPKVVKHPVYKINFSGCFLCVFTYGNTGKDKVKKADSENSNISVAEVMQLWAFSMIHDWYNSKVSGRSGCSQLFIAVWKLCLALYYICMSVYSDVTEQPWIIFGACINILHITMHILFPDTTI